MEINEEKRKKGGMESTAFISNLRRGHQPKRVASSETSKRGNRLFGGQEKRGKGEGRIKGKTSERKFFKVL